MSITRMEWIIRRSTSRVRSKFESRGAARAAFRGVGIAVAGLIVAAPAFAHYGPDLLLPDDDYVVTWYQPHGNPAVEYWDVEINPIDGSGRYVVDAQAMPDESCWSLNVPTDKPAFVRLRSVSGNKVSNWTPITSVPEPGFALATFVGVGVLSAFASKRGRPRKRVIDPNRRRDGARS